MDFAHFKTLVLGTLQHDLTEPGLALSIDVRDEGNRWVAEVMRTGRGGGARENVRPGLGHAEAVATVARLVEHIRDLP
jgi:hypothetical protein